jgi:hypothetical protein
MAAKTTKGSKSGEIWRSRVAPGPVSVQSYSVPLAPFVTIVSFVTNVSR